MPVTDAETKNERLLQVQIFARQRPEGFRTQEIADLLNVSERTARRYIVQLSESGRLPVYYEGRLWHLVEGAQFDLLPVHLNLDEALALYLAARLLAAYGDKHNPHAVSALNKLASAMPEPVGEHITRTASAADRRRLWSSYLGVLETLTLAWATRRQVYIVYWNPEKGDVTERIFDPYFIEPSPVGYACYVIGYDHLRHDIREFKIERVQQVKILDSSYEIRDNFDPYDYLTQAWGVMGGDERIVVKLRFSPDVAYRVRESDWPCVDAIDDLPDGGCLMTLTVSHTLEMKPWIRGWGADCEVIEPEELRQVIAKDMIAAGRMYEKEKSMESDL